MNRDITYIVTGCTGYVGNVLTKKLIAEGCRVVGFARSREKFERVFEDRAPEIVYGDISFAGRRLHIAKLPERARKAAQ